MPPDLRPHVQACAMSSALIGAVLIAGGIAISNPLMFLAGIMIPVSWQIADLTMTDGGRRGIVITKFVAWATNGQVIRCMDFTHHERVAVAWPRGDGAWHGWLRWNMASGHVVLLPNGLVSPSCECRFIYVWKPLDRALEIELMLRADHWPIWDEWRRMTHDEMLRSRSEMLAR